MLTFSMCVSCVFDFIVLLPIGVIKKERRKNNFVCEGNPVTANW